MNRQNAKTLKLTALAMIGFHFLMVILHSVAHEILGVKASPAQLAFIIPVIIIAPVVAGFMIPKFEKAGTVLMTISMFGSFLFGLYYHFIADTIDHVAHVSNMQPAFWAGAFEITAYLLVFSEFFGAVAAGLLSLKQSQSFKNYAARTSF